MATITIEVPDDVAIQLKSLPDEARARLSVEVSSVISEISQAGTNPSSSAPATLADRLRGRVGRIKGGRHPDGRAWSEVEEAA